MTTLFIIAPIVLFISEQIEVTRSKTDNQPVGFFWKGKKTSIIEILAAWQDWRFSQGVSRANWKQRRHRNYYQVKCNDDKVYEIYLDRTAGEEWFLYRILGRQDIENGR